MNQSNYQDNCSGCDALCCKSFIVRDFYGIVIKSISDNACKHLNFNQCSVYQGRDVSLLSTCSEYSCLGAGPILTKWMKNHNVMEYFPQISDRNKLISTLLGIMQDSIMYLLGIQYIGRINSVSTENHLDVLRRIEGIMSLIRPSQSTQEIKDIFKVRLT